MHSPALDGIYAALLPEKPKPELCKLFEKAIKAQDAARFHAQKLYEREWTDGDDAWQTLLDASFEEARQRLWDHLLDEYQIGTELRKRAGEVLT